MNNRMIPAHYRSEVTSVQFYTLNTDKILLMKITEHRIMNNIVLQHMLVL